MQGEHVLNQFTPRIIASGGVESFMRLPLVHDGDSAVGYMYAYVADLTRADRGLFWYGGFRAFNRLGLVTVVDIGSMILDPVDAGASRGWTSVLPVLVAETAGMAVRSGGSAESGRSLGWGGWLDYYLVRLP